MPKSQRFILDRARICGHILCKRSFGATLICWCKAGRVLKLELKSTVGDFWKKSISPVLLGLTSSLKWENSLYLKPVLNENLLLMRRLSLDYFCQGFVFTRADNNLFVTQLIMCEINLSRHHVFVPLCGTLNTIKFIWEVETHAGENFFQFNYQ